MEGRKGGREGRQGGGGRYTCTCMEGEWRGGEWREREERGGGIKDRLFSAKPSAPFAGRRKRGAVFWIKNTGACSTTLVL